MWNPGLDPRWAAVLIVAACAPAARASEPSASSCASAPAEEEGVRRMVLSDGRVEVRGARTLAPCELPAPLLAFARGAGEEPGDRLLLRLEGLRTEPGRGLDLLVFVDRPSSEGPFRTSDAGYAGAVTLLADGRGTGGISVVVPMSRALAAAVRDDGSFAITLAAVERDGSLSPHPVTVERIVLDVR